MDFFLTLRTLRHLRPRQIFWQVLRKAIKVRFKYYDAPQHRRITLHSEPIPRPVSCEGDTFTFLNLSHRFTDWNESEFGPLWTNNLCYFDWLGQNGMLESQGAAWIDRFIAAFDSVGQGRRPYATSLRIVNWVRFFSKYPAAVTSQREKFLYSQYRWLERNIEWQTMGNHVLENACALVCASVYFDDGKRLSKHLRLLQKSLAEQILPDGAHFEQSPMYHCILLDRLLDCINLLQGSELDGVNGLCLENLRRYAVRMLGHLENIVWNDRTIPMLNDSACGIAPSPDSIFGYAQCLGLEWSPIPLNGCGFRKMSVGLFEAFVDVGNITASYQPGHSHADTLTYELRIGGKPVVVDTGISTYNKNTRRQYERGSEAHNCVCVDERNSSEVWGGFRMGRRAKVKIISQNADCTEIIAEHNGYHQPCMRRYMITDKSFAVEDWFNAEAVSYIHMAENIKADQITFEGARSIESEDCLYSNEYNQFKTGKVMKITFNGHLKTVIGLS